MTEKITRKSKISEIVQKHPEAVELLLEKGFHCIGCHVAQFESLEDGASAHGFSDDDIDNLVEDINKLIKKKK